VKLSVVVRSKDEADRLRLTLTSLAAQRPTEVIVVDDGSSDLTGSVIAEAVNAMPLKSVRHRTARGRSAASNAGARIATGDVILFLDGDTLPGPNCLNCHIAAHGRTLNLVGRGETFHLRATRFLLNPETATPRPGEERRLAEMSSSDRERLKVTRRQIVEDFDSIECRAQPGVYPGIGPRQLYELEINALREHADCAVLWAASSGTNFSVRREAFLESGGFDERLGNNEHRELALRLCQTGGKMDFIAGARTYHLTHRSGWRDPLVETGWESVFYERHPITAVKLLSVLWASLSDKSPIPKHARITSLPELERAARGATNIDYDSIRRLIPGLPELLSLRLNTDGSIPGR
jgi:glycosyltransferase involved in cell wall biosynthesis